MALITMHDWSDEILYLETEIIETGDNLGKQPVHRLARIRRIEGDKEYPDYRNQHPFYAEIKRITKLAEALDELINSDLSYYDELEVVQEAEAKAEALVAETVKIHAALAEKHTAQHACAFVDVREALNKLSTGAVLWHTGVTKALRNKQDTNAPPNATEFNKILDDAYQQAKKYEAPWWLGHEVCPAELLAVSVVLNLPELLERTSDYTAKVTPEMIQEAYAKNELPDWLRILIVEAVFYGTYARLDEQLFFHEYDAKSWIDDKIKESSFMLGFMLDRQANRLGATGWDFLVGDPALQRERNT